MTEAAQSNRAARLKHVLGLLQEVRYIARDNDWPILERIVLSAIILVGDMQRDPTIN